MVHITTRRLQNEAQRSSSETHHVEHGDIHHDDHDEGNVHGRAVEDNHDDDEGAARADGYVDDGGDGDYDYNDVGVDDYDDDDYEG